MNKSASFGVMLTLLFTSILAFAFNIQVVRATGTIYIRSDGSVEGTDKIQRNGDVYTFIDNLYDSIVVERNNTVIDGNGYTLQGTREYWSTGIGLTERINVTIQNTKITDFYFGIGIWRSSNTSVTGNDLTANAFAGIYLATSYDNSVSGNNITANDWSGIFLDYSHYNSISRNNITANNGDGFILSWYSSHNTISGNNITENSEDGIHVYDSRSNSISGNNITANKNHGMNLDGSRGDNITTNTIEDNGCGIRLSWGRYSSSGDDTLYHNNFIANTQQVNNEWPPNMVNSIWDDGYSSGGNYWSDYADLDLYNGPYQNLSGMDGIWDHPYVIDVNNRDRYPLVKPWPTVAASVDVDPEELNMRSRGKWITTYIELPTHYDIDNIDTSTIMLNYTFTIDYTAPAQIGDHDLDGILDLMVKFNRTQLELYIYDVLGIKYSSVTLKIAGRLLDGTPFEGTDVVFVNYAGDVNSDGKIDVLDVATISAHWHPGPPTGPFGYDANADLNNDGFINILDSGIISGNWGQTVP